MKAFDDKKAKLEELRNILIKKGFLDQGEEVIVAMMEDLIHFAYLTGCITKSDLKKFLGLTDKEAKAKIKSWKFWNEGNRSCGLSRNPFSEEWNLIRENKTN